MQPAGHGSVVSRSLIKLMKHEPAVGWVRGDTVPSTDAVAEIVRLQRRVQELESDISRIATQPPQGTEELAQGEDEFEFECGYSRYGLQAR